MCACVSVDARGFFAVCTLKVHRYGSQLVARMLQFPATLEPLLRRPIHGLGSLTSCPGWQACYIIGDFAGGILHKLLKRLATVQQSALTTGISIVVSKQDRL